MKKKNYVAPVMAQGALLAQGKLLVASMKENLGTNSVDGSASLAREMNDSFWDTSDDK